MSFLKRVDSPSGKAVLETLTHWLSHVPEPHRAALLSRLQSKDERQSDAAFWELYIHEALQRDQWKVSVHPDLPGTMRRLDYDALRRGESVYFEATSINSTNPQMAEKARLDALLDGINRMKHIDFWLDFTTITVGDNSFPVAKLRVVLYKWIQSLDADGYLPPNPSGWDHWPVTTCDWDGWSIQFRAIPKGPEARGRSDVRPIGAISPSILGIVDHRTPLIREFKEKGEAYGQLDRPLILAVLASGESFPTIQDYTHELYGRMGNGQAGSGIWSGTDVVNPTVSGILFSSMLRPWTIVTNSPVLFHNPHAVRPLPPAAALPWPSVRLDLQAGRVEEVPGLTTLDKLFGLPSDWPGPPPWLDNDEKVDPSLRGITATADGDPGVEVD